MSTTADHPDSAAPAAGASPAPAAPSELDASVDELLKDAAGGPSRPSNGVGGSAHAGGGGSPRPVPKPVAPAKPPSTDELPQELIGPGGTVIARREPKVEADSAAAADDAMAGVQADLAPPPTPDPMAAAPQPAPAPATIAALDDALARKAEVQLEESTAPAKVSVTTEPAPAAPPLVRAVAANPPPTPIPDPHASPVVPPAPTTPILRPDAPMAAARSGAPPIAAATPAAMAATPPPLPVQVEAKPGILTAALGPLAAKAERLSSGARQTILWATFVTFISAAALWTIVLIRDPNAVPAAAAPAAASHGEDSHGSEHEKPKAAAKPEKAASSHSAPAKPSAPAKSGGHH